MPGLPGIAAWTWFTDGVAKKMRTVARHARLGTLSPIRQIITVVAVVALVAGVSVTSVGAFSVYTLAQTFTENAVALEDEVAVPPPNIGPYSDAFTMLVVGTDECEEQFIPIFGDRCQGDDSGGQLNDVNMLVHVSVNPRRVTVVSFPRDLMLSVPSCTDEEGYETSPRSKAQINSVYAIGGLNCVAKTVSDLTGLPIPFAAKVSFGGVVGITDAIGGVDVCIGNGGIYDPDTGIDWPAGMRNVQGLAALGFLRTRKGVGDGSDLSRIGNQQQYLSRLARKLSSDQVLSDPGALYRLATAAVQNITPSQSLTNPLRMVQLGLAVKDVPFDQITFLQYPVYGDPDDRNRVVPDYDAGGVLFAALVANQPLQITGDASSNGGVIVTNPGTPVDPSTVTPDPNAPPPVALPDNINGSTAAQETCSAGNVSG